MSKLAVVVAATTFTNGIGKGGTLPWPRLPSDMSFFKEVTTKAPSNHQNALIMGRKTWESLPQKFRPLPGRLNMVISRNEATRAELNAMKNVKAFASFAAAVQAAQDDPSTADIFVIGGSSVYQEALRSPLCQTIYLTQVYKQFDCDTFLPTIDTNRFVVSKMGEVHTENGVPFQIVTLVADPTKAKKSQEEAKSGLEQETETPQKPAKATEVPQPAALGFGSRGQGQEHEEMQYLNLIREIIEGGNKRGDRTGVGTMSRFGAQFRFNLDGQFPLLTTKRVFFRGVAEELFWMIRGCTDAKELSAKRVHIWDGNGSREFLDKSGFKDRRVGDLGPVYGFQWRHFGAQYKGPDEDYSGQGKDQLSEVISLIKHNPESRRIIMSAWNAPEIKNMALPPCHVMAQFYVHEGRLSCHLYQRSADLGLGVPFNIASYSLLTYLLAHFTGLKPGEFVHSFGDAHVYLNHIEPLQEQLKRTPRPFPRLLIKDTAKDLESIQFSDLELVDYQPYKTIKMEMAV